MAQEVRTDRAVVETLVELLDKYGPALERLADHFDKLEKKGITDRAAHEVRERPRRDEGSDPAGDLIDLVAGALKHRVRQQRRR